MKRVVLGLLAFLMTVTTYGQGIGINETNASPAASAILDVSSTDKGFLTPRMTTAQRYAVNSPADGLLVFDTDENCFAVYKMSAWYLLCGTLDAGSVKTLSIISGNGQSGCESSVLGSPVLVELLDGNGTPVVGSTLNFTVTAGGGNPSVATVVTNVSGQAQVNWTVGLTGAQTMEISGTGITKKAANASIVACSACGASNIFVDGRDSETYGTITIGGKRWMAENLRYNAPGSQLNPANPSICYGRLYNWATLMNGATSSSANPSGVQGVCPSGWHIPSDSEWKDLEMALGISSADANTVGSRGTNQGAQLKSTTGWNSNVNNTNSTGFNAFPANGYYPSTFYGLGAYAYFWSSTQKDANFVWYRHLTNADSMVNRNYGNKDYSHSCRCVEN
jgi:uncharacterized protein (TIGR02145 family)